MGLFKWSDERIADEIARMTAARDFADLADELHNGYARRRSAAAAALASFGQEAIPAIVAATLPRSDDDSARRGAWAAFKAMGGTASHWVTTAVMSPDTLLADDVPGTLRYWERAVAAIGPASQGDVALCGRPPRALAPARGGMPGNPRYARRAGEPPARHQRARPHADLTRSPEAERRRREDLLVGTLALASLRTYARKGAGLGLTPALVSRRVALLAELDGDQTALLSVSRLAALVLCCEMHLGEPASALTDEPTLVPLLGVTAAPGTSGTIDRTTVLKTLRTLRVAG